MIVFCKFLFDIAVYCMLAGYYGALFGLKPVPPVFAAMAVPPALYIVYSVSKGLTDTDYDAFRSQFIRGLQLLTALLPGFMFGGKAIGALQGVLPFICIMLLDGICLLRILRDDRSSSKRQMIYLGVFLAAGLLLTAGGILQKTGHGIAWFYEHVAVHILMAAGMAIAYLFYYVLVGLYHIMMLFSAPDSEQGRRMEQLAEGLRTDPIIEEGSAALPEAMRILAIALLVLLVLYMLFRLFKGMLGQQAGKYLRRPYTDRRESLREASQGKGRRPGFFRPARPDLAVRYYYAKFLRECRKRGVFPSEGMTSEEIAGLAASAFPGADPRALQQIYVRARYGMPEQVKETDARQAERIWKELKLSGTK